MRYFSYNEIEPVDELAEEYSNVVVTLSEEEIRTQYWDYWYGRMCSKFGKENVDKKFSWQDCLDDWIIINWAWEVND